MNLIKPSQLKRAQIQLNRYFSSYYSRAPANLNSQLIRTQTNFP